jgi:carboxylesterase type B
MDAAAVLEWTKINIEKHGGDPEKIYLSGESAVSGTVCVASIA